MFSYLKKIYNASGSNWLSPFRFSGFASVDISYSLYDSSLSTRSKSDWSSSGQFCRKRNMKNNIEPMIQSMIKINNSMKRTECDDEFFFEDRFFKIAELFSSDVKFFGSRCWRGNYPIIIIKLRSSDCHCRSGSIMREPVRTIR